MRELMQYKHHEWWAHHLLPGQRVKGTLDAGDGAERVLTGLELKDLRLSYSEDRPKIDFLFRQSKLLGKAMR